MRQDDSSYTLVLTCSGTDAVELAIDNGVLWIVLEQKGRDGRESKQAVVPVAGAEVLGRGNVSAAGWWLVRPA